MAKRLIVFILICQLALLYGCYASKVIDVEVGGNTRTDLKIGQIVNLHFEANPTTGYIWHLKKKKGYDALKRLGDYKYVPGSPRIGAGGVQTYSFEAAGRGTATLIFEYSRPWETDKRPAKRYTVKIDVH